MERMPLAILIFYSIPESVVLVSLASSLFGYDVRKNFRRILILGTILALTTVFARLFPIFINVLVELPLFIVFTSVILQVSKKTSALIILTGFVFIVIAESVFSVVTVNLFNLTLAQAENTIPARLISEWSRLLPLLILTIITVRKNITFSGTLQTISTMNSRKFYLIIIIILLQAFLTGALQMINLNSQDSFWQFPIDAKTMQVATTVSLLIFPFISLYFIRRMLVLSEVETMARTQEAFLSSINDLFTTIRAQRHDFLNHVHVMSLMLNSNKPDQAKGYMNDLLNDIRIVNEAILFKDPALNAILNTKKAMAQCHGIEFNIIVKAPCEDLKIRPHELVTILGNIIDNAFEALAEVDPDKRSVTVTVKRDKDNYVFDIHNPQPVIEQNRADKIFQPGFTTKAGHTGLGLASALKLARENKGDIKLTSSADEGTLFQVILPAG